MSTLAAKAMVILTFLNWFCDMRQAYGNKTEKTTGIRTRRGQVAVEYILLLFIGVSIASLVIALVVSRNPDSPGFLISKWRQIIELIGTDVIDP